MYGFGGHISACKSLLEMDCFITIHQSGLKPFPWVCGAKVRMTRFSFLLLSFLVTTHHSPGGS